MLEAADEESNQQSSFTKASTESVQNEAEKFQQIYRHIFEESEGGDDDVKFSLGASSTPSRRGARKIRGSKSILSTPTTQLNNLEREDEVNFGSPESDMELDDEQLNLSPSPTGSNVSLPVPPGPPPFISQNIPHKHPES